MRIFKNQNPLVKVYSHPRSGTHLIEHFLGVNYYNNVDLHAAPVAWGHWSNRKSNKNGNPYGLLFGNHFFPSYKQPDLSNPSVYVYRDGRAVSLSVWKTPNFINKEWAGISFKEFLRKKLDWHGSPSLKVESPYLTILEHWSKHLNEWFEIKEGNLLFVNFESIVNDPNSVAEKLEQHFGIKRKSKKLTTIDSPVGLLPNAASNNEWAKFFGPKEQEVYDAAVNRYDTLKEMRDGRL